jgi:hypothetical protein
MLAEPSSHRLAVSPPIRFRCPIFHCPLLSRQRRRRC